MQEPRISFAGASRSLRTCRPTALLRYLQSTGAWRPCAFSMPFELSCHCEFNALSWIRFVSSSGGSKRHLRLERELLVYLVLCRQLCLLHAVHRLLGYHRMVLLLRYSAAGAHHEPSALFLPFSQPHRPQRSTFCSLRVREEVDMFLSAHPSSCTCRREERLDSSVARHQVGTVIQHRRYGYKGLIFGWDPTCKRPKSWVEKNRVDELEHGEPSAFLLAIDCNPILRLGVPSGVQLFPALAH